MNFREALVDVMTPESVIGFAEDYSAWSGRPVVVDARDHWQGINNGITLIVVDEVEGVTSLLPIQLWSEAFGPNHLVPAERLAGITNFMRSALGVPV